MLAHYETGSGVRSTAKLDQRTIEEASRRAEGRCEHERKLLTAIGPTPAPRALFGRETAEHRVDRKPYRLPTRPASSVEPMVRDIALPVRSDHRISPHDLVRHACGILHTHC